MPGKAPNGGYFSISADQFRMTDKGAAFGDSTFVLTRNLCPSPVFQVSHDQKAGAVLRTNIVQMADMGMIQAGNGARFALKPQFRIGIVRQMRGQSLNGFFSVRAGFDNNRTLHTAYHGPGAS